MTGTLFFLFRSIQLPLAFTIFTGYNDWKRKKIKKTRLSNEDLKQHEDKLSSLLSQPWFARKVFESVRLDTEGLLHAIHKYSEYLKQQTSTIKEVHHSLHPQRSPETNVCMNLLPVVITRSTDYTQICNELSSKPDYFPVCVNDFAPSDRYTRRHWIDNLSFPYKVMLMKYPYGNRLGTLSFVWKVLDEADEIRHAQVILQVTEQCAMYSTREMKRDFIDKYNSLVATPKSVLRCIFNDLTGDSSSAPTQAQKIIDEKVASAVLTIGDPDILLDLRKLNGNPKATLFDDFWTELSLFLEELTPAVDDRRHGEVLHMPIAVSVRHLRDVLTERLSLKFPYQVKAIPSEEWIRLQFWPRNPYEHSSLHHTGRFNVKQKVQIRQQRKDHQDSKYCSVILKYARQMYRDVVTYMSVDDKAIIPKGEPGLPIAATSRRHNSSLVLGTASLEALDHDFHIHGIVPSVTFVDDIPETPH